MVLSEIGMNGRIAVVLVNYRGWRDTVECLASLRAVQYPPGLEMVVVDNGSDDESVAEIRARFPDVFLLEMGKNLGFAGGCNAGMRFARERGNEFIWLLNNDTTVDPRAARALVDVAQSHPEASFFGSLISFVGEPQRVWFGGGKYGPRTGLFGNVGYNRLVSEFDGQADAIRTDWISGCSLFIRSSLLDEIGFMDEDFFLYLEEVEWELRRPHSAWLVPRALVQHKSGQTTGGTSRARLGRVFMSRNFLKLAWRRAGKYLPLWLGRWVLYQVLGPALKGRPRLAWAALAGVAELRSPGAAIVERWRS
jgi:GT2 family glycosyltransferase